MTFGGKQMAERVKYNWDDDRGSHSVCSDCLRAFGNAATCRSDTDPQDAVREVCMDESTAEKD